MVGWVHSTLPVSGVVTRRYSCVVPTCIYCSEQKGGDEFRGVEHVLPAAFGGYKDSLTLPNTVCDACNAEFSRTLDLYLARDTPIGIARYLLGHKNTAEYKDLGRRRTVTTEIGEGRLTGALLAIKPGEEALGLQPLPQLGFGPTPDGPFKWYLMSKLPPKDELRRIVDAGRHYVEFLEITDLEGTLELLRGLGLTKMGDLRQTAPAGVKGRQYVESVATLSQTFGRAIAKIGMNYVASQHGSAVALMSHFDAIRKYIRYVKPMPRGTWGSQPVPPGTEPGDHILAVSWDAFRRRIHADVCFYGRYRYRVALADPGYVVSPSFEARGHRYVFRSMTVEPISRSALALWF